VGQFIDVAEDIGELGVGYGAEATYCRLKIAGFAGFITVTSHAITFTFHKAETPKEMAVQLQAASGLLQGIPNVQKALPL